MKQYIIEYGSNQGNTGSFESTSRDSKRHGRELLGTAGGGWIRVWDTTSVLKWQACDIDRWARKVVSVARYTPENGGRWYNGSPSFSSDEEEEYCKAQINASSAFPPSWSRNPNDIMLDHQGHLRD